MATQQVHKVQARAGGSLLSCSLTRQPPDHARLVDFLRRVKELIDKNADKDCVDSAREELERVKDDWEKVQKLVEARFSHLGADVAQGLTSRTPINNVKEETRYTVVNMSLRAALELSRQHRKKRKIVEEYFHLISKRCSFRAHQMTKFLNWAAMYAPLCSLASSQCPSHHPSLGSIQESFLNRHP